ncbi:MAG TPA: protocatechuate 3,4-dioxygenase subunit alpha [Solirubrobacteraceae bacterium]|nr:protocatechuate 3,4-dioxygenase subunit alpha [Solirubrobacteraceae bacterium]
MTLQPTADQTVGPFFRDGLGYDGDRHLVEPGTPGAIVLDGRVLDGDGAPVPDALLEIWQPDAAGAIVREHGTRERRPGSFSGFGRCETDPEGWYAFTTVEPAPLRDGAPVFFAVNVFARGLLAVLRTRIYLPDDAAALASDPLLAGLDPERRATLIAGRTGAARLRHDIRLQGAGHDDAGETVFLAFR